MAQIFHPSTNTIARISILGAVFIVYRTAYLAGFMEGSQHLKLLLETLNTAVLLSSSLTMALAVHAAQEGQTRPLVRFVLLTILLGLVFLGIKGMEYWLEYDAGLVPRVRFDYNGAHATQVKLLLWHWPLRSAKPCWWCSSSCMYVTAAG